MSKQRALVVDDSKTARIRLKKLLVDHDFEIDMAASAEEALGYLSYAMPSVIFMDHHMEGMDGLEALKIIKSNPSTATIPVIMYTSEKGEVYAGQAYALGALDILSKELIKPSLIEEAIKKLRQATELEPVEAASPRENVESAHDDADRLEASSHVFATRRLSENANVQAQVARLFELHIADVRQQMKEHTKFIVRRLSSDIERRTQDGVKESDLAISAVREEARRVSSKLGVVSNTVLLLLLMGVAVIYYQSSLNRQLLESLSFQNNEFAAGLGELKSLTSVNGSEQAAASYDTLVIDDDLQLDLLSWALQSDWSFNFGQAPLNESMVLKLQNLVTQLDYAGFDGSVYISVNFGVFCLQEDPIKGFILAEETLPADACIYSSEVINAEAQSALVQNAASQLLLNSSAVSSGRIGVQSPDGDVSGNVLEYPDAYRVSAGVWNSIARKNNRLLVSLSR